MGYNDFNQFERESKRKCYKLPFLDPFTRWYIFTYMPFVRKGVSLPITDAVRMGREIKIDTENQDIIDAINKRCEKLDSAIEEMLIQAGIFGSAIIVMGLLDDVPSNPINYNRLNPYSFQHFTILNNTNFTVEIEHDWSKPNYNQPKRYICTLGCKQIEIHPDRVLLGWGYKSQVNEKYTEADLGTSIIDSAYFLLDDEFDTAINMAHLVSKSNVDVFSVPNLNQKMTFMEQDEKRENSFYRFLSRFKNLLSNHKVILTDSSNSLVRMPIDNMDSVKNINEFQLEKLGGAFDVPVERFLSRVKATLNNGAGNNKDNYSRKTKDILHNKVKPLHMQHDLILESMYKVNITYTYADYKSTTDEEKSTLYKNISDTANINILNQTWEQQDVLKFYKKFGLNIGTSEELLPDPTDK